MTNGERLNFIKSVFLPASIRAARSGRPSTCSQSHNVKLKLPKTTSTTLEKNTVTKEDDDWSPIWEFLPNSEKHPKTKDTYYTVTVILCVGVGFLIFMIVTMRMLYNMFKFKQGDDDQSSSKRRKKTSRRPRRTGSVVSRRLSRSGSIISTRST